MPTTTDLDRRILAVLTEERRHFPIPLGEQSWRYDLGLIQNRTVLRLRGEGAAVWMEAKDGDNTAILPNGVTVTKDIIQTFEDGQLWGRDFLGATGSREATPMLGTKGPALASKSVLPVEEHEPPPPPPDLSAVLVKLDALQKQMDAATEHIVALVAESAILEDKLNALLEKPGATCPPVVFPTYSGRLGMVLRLTPEPTK